jgi:hypothetical protein
MTSFTESMVEEAALAWLRSLGWSVLALLSEEWAAA